MTITRADMIAYLEGKGFECTVQPKPCSAVYIDQLCMVKRFNGVPVSYIGDLPGDPTVDHNCYIKNIWHDIMMILTSQYGFGTA